MHRSYNFILNNNPVAHQIAGTPQNLSCFNSQVGGIVTLSSMIFHSILAKARERIIKSYILAGSRLTTLLTSNTENKTKLEGIKYVKPKSLQNNQP